MQARDLFSKEALDELVDATSMKSYMNRMKINSGLCAFTTGICIREAFDHASNGNYKAALTLTMMGTITFIMGYYEARRAHALSTTSLDELHPPTLEITEVRNPLWEYVDD